MLLFTCVSLIPLAVYLLAMGVCNLRRKPLVVRGSRDAQWLGLALSGFAIVGPLELFLPETAAFRFGPWAWMLMLALYLLLVSLWSLTLRPRLVVYNVTQEELRPLVAELSRELDPEARWAGDSLTMPKLDVRLHLETSQAIRNVELASSGSQQNDEGWKRLETELRKLLATRGSRRNLRGLQMVGLAIAMLVIVGLLLVRDYRAIAQALENMLRM
ncbi:MAG TPA: hypothetical protein VIY86_12765 [Pirellulaceae bacterium]